MWRLLVGPLLAVVLGLVVACSDGAAKSGPPVAPLLRSTVYVTKGKDHGSGMIIGPGLVLTAHHVVRGNRQPDIRFFNGEQITGQVIWSEPGRDLALVEVDIPPGHPVAPLFCDQLTPGQPITAVGHPLQAEWVASRGKLPKTKGYHAYLRSIGLAIGKGASGGPVFDEQGQVIGIILTILTRQLYAKVGTGYMLPAGEFCDKIREKQAARLSKH